MAITRYECLSEADKDFLGKEETEGKKKWKEGLEKSQKESTGLPQGL